MNFKKFISGVSAFAIAASAFAGMAVTANAATSVTDDCSDAASTQTSPFVWTYTGSDSKCSSGIVEWKEQTGVKIANIANASKDINATGTFANSTTTKLVNVKVNAYISGCNSGNNNTVDNQYNQKWYLKDAAGNVAAKLASQYASLYTVDVADNTFGSNLNIPMDHKGIGEHLGRTGDAKTGSTEGYVDIDFLLNFYTHTATISYGTTSIEESIPETITSINTFSIDLGRCYNGVLINNVTVTEYECPELTIDDSATIEVGGSKTITPSAIVGTLTSAVSDDESVATASVSDGAVKIDGVATGSAKVTVTASNDGQTQKRVIDVTVGVPETVNIYYYETGTQTSVKSTDTRLLSSGSVINAADVDTATVTTSDGRYTYNDSATGATAFPYTVVSGTNNIYLYFDKDDAVKTLHVSYQANNTEVGSSNSSLSGKYVGDKDNGYSYPAYITNAQNKVTYAYSGTAGVYGGTVDFSAENTSNGTATVEVPYTAYNGTAYFQEIDELAAYKCTVFNGTQYSNGKSKSGVTPDQLEIFTVPESGVYNITIAADARGDGVTISLYNNDSDHQIGDTKTLVKDTMDKYEFESAALKKGDTIKISGSSSHARLDYILLEKTGDVKVGEFVDQNWDAESNTTGYTVDGNTLTDDKENVVYAYSSTFTAADGATYKMIVTNGNESFERSVTDTVIASESQVMFFLITNDVINKAGSYVTYAE